MLIAVRKPSDFDLRVMDAILLHRYECVLVAVVIVGSEKMPGKGQHVVPQEGKWAVRKSGADKVTRTYDTQHEAIDAARGIARNQGAEVYIHGRDGRIRERDSYGNDPYPPKG